jgi:mRNA-degrading endonuclease YafQ of YafQ-DinJ toxin-antitoxin module
MTSIIVKNILTSRDFEKNAANLPLIIQKKAEDKILLFKSNPFHPSLRLHKLSGDLESYWSISIDMKHRIIIKIRENGDIILVTIGKHDIYRCL